MIVLTGLAVAWCGCGQDSQPGSSLLPEGTRADQPFNATFLMQNAADAGPLWPDSTTAVGDWMVDFYCDEGHQPDGDIDFCQVSGQHWVKFPLPVLGSVVEPDDPTNLFLYNVVSAQTEGYASSFDMCLVGEATEEGEFFGTCARGAQPDEPELAPVVSVESWSDVRHVLILPRGQGDDAGRYHLNVVWSLGS
jgi:hypothetical protein